MKPKYLFLFSIFLLVAGCASSKQYVPLADLSRPVDNSQSRIIIVRPTIFGSAIRMKVREGIRAIGVTGPNSFLAWDREPGRASIVSNAENDDVLDLELEKGQTYYVQQHIRMGIVTARNQLELLPEEKGKNFLKKCKPPKVELKEALKDDFVSVH